MEDRDFYVLAYDISDDRRRAKIARLMESMGARVQGSVFEAYLKANELEDLLRRAKKVMKPQEDGLRVYPLCRACRAKICTEGTGQVSEPPGLMIV